MKIVISIESDELGDLKVTREIEEKTRAADVQDQLDILLEKAVKQARRAYDIEPAF